MSEKSEKFELIATDGYSIERTVYPTEEAARTAMESAYNELNQNTPGDEWDESSWLGEEESTLLNKGENVYCWAIYKI